MKNQTLLRLALLFLMLVGRMAFAQSDSVSTQVVDDAALRMLKATVEFLATDTQTFGKVKYTVCTDCQTEERILAFIGENNLTNASSLLARVRQRKMELLWERSGQALSEDVVTQILEDLSQYLKTEVTKGRSREHRMQLPTYPAFAEALEQAIAQENAPSSELQVVDRLASRRSVSDSVRSLSADAPTITADVPAPSPEAFPYGMVALGLALFNLVVMGVLGWRQRQEGVQMAEGALDELTERLVLLENERIQVMNRLRVAEHTLQISRGHQLVSAELAHATPTSAMVQPVPAATRPEPVSVPAAVPIPKAASPAPAPRPEPRPMGSTATQDVVMFGRTADLGDGFSRFGLQSVPHRDTIFEIYRLDQTQATYRISESSELQRLALSDPYSYLANTCTYLTPPRPGSRILTEHPGHLLLQGDKWVITEKAQISFL